MSVGGGQCSDEFVDESALFAAEDSRFGSGDERFDHLEIEARPMGDVTNVELECVGDGAQGLEEVWCSGSSMSRATVVACIPAASASSLRLVRPTAAIAEAQGSGTARLRGMSTL